MSGTISSASPASRRREPADPPAAPNKGRGKGVNRLLVTMVMMAALTILALPTGAAAQATATPGKALKMVLVPKWLGSDRISKMFGQVREGAQEAARELQNPVPLQFDGPAPGHSVPGQIDIVTKATSEGANAIMISNNSGEQIVPALKAAQDKGIKVVSWDSLIPSAEGEDVYIAQADFSTTGKVMADMALSILGADGGEFAILAATPGSAGPNAWIKAFQEALKDPKYAKLKQVDLVYGSDQSEPSYQQARALTAKHPGLKLIMAPTSVAIAAAAKAIHDEKLCDKVKVSGLGVPSEMRSYTMEGCAPQFALWSFVDLGYLAYYTAYLLATDAIQGQEGQQFTAGRLGRYTIAKDPNRPHGLRVVLGPFQVYDKTNIGGTE
jgi:rhamnose transport system substrate-binding protein